MSATRKSLTSSHWGIGIVESAEGKISQVLPHPDDPSPSSINDNIASSLNGAARVRRPAFRKGWLEPESDVERGRDRFVELEWDEALDRIAAELTRIRKAYGNEAIFAGSYGWSSAGRFHHAQSQLKRLLNTQGGFVRSEGNYSYHAAIYLMPHIVGNYRQSIIDATRWSVIAKHTKKVVCFGGIAERNSQISDGGISKHRLAGNLRACAEAGVKFVNISPLRTDLNEELDAEWLPANPGSDTAVMLGMAHTLLTENLHDQAFLDHYTVGFSKFADYLTGQTDGIIKSAQWAAEQSGIDADRIAELAREIAAERSFITTAAGVQRTDYGEQPLWMTVTLAAMVGQIGLPGGGYCIGSGVNGNIGNMERLFRSGTTGQGRNPVEAFIPVAMVSDMLLNPEKPYQFSGEDYTFPDIKMVWWAGGNPFHHHQDLNQLRRAFQKPETIIVNEINWTATARHADIVLPVAAPQERTDFGAGRSDDALVPMPQAISPAFEARTEYEIFAELERRLGDETAFTQGKSEEE